METAVLLPPPTIIQKNNKFKDLLSSLFMKVPQVDIERLEPSILETVGNGGGGEAAGEETQDITMKDYIKLLKKRQKMTKDVDMENGNNDEENLCAFGDEENVCYDEVEEGKSTVTEPPLDTQPAVTKEEDIVTEEAHQQLGSTPNDRTDPSEETAPAENIRQVNDIIETEMSAPENQDGKSLIDDETDKTIERDEISDLFEVKDEIIGDEVTKKYEGEGCEVEKAAVGEDPVVETGQNLSLKPKIKLYKGYSGELIENSQSKAGKKRKKKDKPPHSRKAKVAKVAKKDLKEQHEMLETLQRINYELPGHNWLEQKIKKNEDSAQKNITPVSGVGSDTAREVTVSDSEDDSLVVVHEEEEEKEMEQVNIAQEVEQDRICTNAEDQKVSVEDNPEGETEERPEIEEINPIQYMMGNLMKKIDENQEPSQTEEESPGVVWSGLKLESKPECGDGAVKTISSEFERTILESRAARLDSDQLKQEQDIQFNESAILQLKKDIDDLKNQKIREMEDLLEMMSKKEVAKVELENLKSEISTHQKFLKKLKNLHEGSHQEVTQGVTREVNQGVTPVMTMGVSPGATPRVSQGLGVSPGATPRVSQGLNLGVSPGATPRVSQGLNLGASGGTPVVSQGGPRPLDYSTRRSPDNRLQIVSRRPSSVTTSSSSASASPALPDLIHEVGAGAKTPEYLYYLHQQNQIINQRNQASQLQVSQIQQLQQLQQAQAAQAQAQAAQAQAQAQNLMKGSGVMPPPPSQSVAQPSGQFSSNIQKFLSPEVQPGGRPGQGGAGGRQQPNKGLMIRPRDFCKENIVQARPSQQTVTRCAVCLSPANFLCSGCQKVYYCTVKCQSRHWANHFMMCKALKK